MKYLFWGSAYNRGIFDEQQLQAGKINDKKKKLSKYQKEELRQLDDECHE